MWIVWLCLRMDINPRHAQAVRADFEIIPDVRRREKRRRFVSFFSFLSRVLCTSDKTAVRCQRNNLQESPPRWKSTLSRFTYIGLISVVIHMLPTNAGLMLGQRRRPWPDIKPASVSVFILNFFCPRRFRGLRCLWDPDSWGMFFLSIQSRWTLLCDPDTGQCPGHASINSSHATQIPKSCRSRSSGMIEGEPFVTILMRIGRSPCVHIVFSEDVRQTFNWRRAHVSVKLCYVLALLKGGRGSQI